MTRIISYVWKKTVMLLLLITSMAYGWHMPLALYRLKDSVQCAVAAVLSYPVKYYHNGYLVQAAEQDNVQQVKQLLEVEGWDIESGNFDVLQEAARCKALTVVQYLLDEWADKRMYQEMVTADGYLALQWALWSGHVDVAEAIYQKAYKLDKKAPDKIFAVAHRLNSPPGENDTEFYMFACKKLLHKN